MDSEWSKDDSANLKQPEKKIRLVASIIVALFLYCRLISFNAALMTMAQFTITKILSRFSKPSFDLGQHYSSVVFSVSALWILYLDPCAFGLAVWVSSCTAIGIVYVMREKINRVIYSSLLILSWGLIAVTNGKFIDHCTNKDTNQLEKDSTLTLFCLIFSIFTLTGHVNANLKAIEISLAEVKELNQKFEGVNKELKQLLENKENFILLFSHETRNPLNILLGNLSLLLNETDNPAIKKRLLRCKFCADLLLQHLNNILDSGKLSNQGTLDVTQTPVKLYEYIQSIQSFMEMLIKKKDQLKSELMIPRRLPQLLNLDSQRVTQVILNLLTNAVKFTDKGTISLIFRYLKKDSIDESDYCPTTGFASSILENNDSNLVSIAEYDESLFGNGVQCQEALGREMLSLAEKKQYLLEETSAEPGYLKIEISDTGCGMKPDELAKLFQKFSQTHSEGFQRQIGTGLGLWITKTLSELMGGGIRVFSKPNIGTVFVAIVRTDSLPTPSIMLNNSPRPIKASIEVPVRRILMADDDPFNLEFHVQAVKRLNFRVIETASDGKILIEKFKSKPEGYFETIITDIHMPHIDGIQAALKIREVEYTENRKTRVKIGFITGHANQKDKLLCQKNPIEATFYLSKPVKSSTLEAFLNPSRDNEETKQQASAELKKDRMISQPRPKILCIDDDIFNLECLQDMFESLDVSTIKAKSGEEGIAFLKSALATDSSVPKFILVDCRMPGMDGWTAAHRMKEVLRQKNKTEIPIIGLTGEDPTRTKDKLRESAMNFVLQKPIRLNELQKLLKMHN